MERKQLDHALPDPEQCNRLLKSLFQIADVMNAKKLTHSRMMEQVLQVVLDYLGVEQ